MIKQMSIMITTHFFLAIDGLKGYFEEHDDENNTIFGFKKDKYLTIIFTNEHQKLLYKEIFKKINKNINRDYVKIKFESTDKLPLNILVNICTLILVVRFKEFIEILADMINFIIEFK